MYFLIFFFHTFPVNTFICCIDLEVSRCFQQHLFLIIYPDQMSIISFNLLLQKHVLRLHFFISYYCLVLLFCYCQQNVLLLICFYLLEKMITKVMTEAATSVFLKICFPKDRQKPEKIPLKEFTFTKIAGFRPAT